MMYEDQYPHFSSIYRQLRQEGIEFPPRPASTISVVSSLGLESPVVGHIEELNQYQESRKTSSINTEEIQIDEKEQNAIREFKHFVGGAIAIINKEKDPDNLAKVTMSQSDIDSIKNYMEIIDDMCANAENIKDLKNEIGQIGRAHV